MSYLTAGSQLFQQMIETIRGIVEVDAQKQQVEYEKGEKNSDRELQTLIAVVGVGIGVAGVTATAFPYYLKPPDSPPKLQLFPGNSSPHPVTQSISISLVIGLLASVGVWGLIQLWRISHQKKRDACDWLHKLLIQKSLEK